MPTEPNALSRLERRDFLRFLSALGLGGAVLPVASGVNAAGPDVTPEMVASAAELAGLNFSDEERDELARSLNRLRDQYDAIRAVPMSNEIAPAFQFNPEPAGFAADGGPNHCATLPTDELQSEDEREIAFAGIPALAGALRSGRLSSERLTRISLERLKRFDPQLECVTTITEERAMERAARADALLKSGDAESLLCGIPWGAKDLLAVKGYPTTWGALPFKDQHFEYDASVVERLDRAGAVLTAKLTLGALAMGDVWYGGRTNSPWNLKRGSSGSSAGPAAATAAGLVAFGIGSETNGSIMSPATVCGLTGLRPTFGRISRHGAMALSWTMDKLGPLCRSAQDCAIVFHAIHGSDGHDPTAVDRRFEWAGPADPARVRLGFVKSAFEESPRESDAATLASFESMGFELIPIDLPTLPYNELMLVLTVEAAAAFDDLTRGDRDENLAGEGASAWPGVFRSMRFVPAVEYIQANRVRTLLMRELADRFRVVDAYLTPTMSALLLTNLTGHPMLCMPNGANDDGEPTSIGIVGQLHTEQTILGIADAYQRQSEHHLRRPPVS